MILFGNLEHARMIARRSGSGFDPHVDFVISRVRQRVSGTLVLNNPELLGGVTYTGYTSRSVLMHQAAFAPKDWTTPQFMWVIYDFPFNRLNVEKVIATVPSTNRRAMGITKKMGFKWVATIPEVVPDGDMEVLSMSRDECKYLKLGRRYTALENAA